MTVTLKDFTNLLITEQPKTVFLSMSDFLPVITSLPPLMAILMESINDPPKMGFRWCGTEVLIKDYNPAGVVDLSVPGQSINAEEIARLQSSVASLLATNTELGNHCDRLSEQLRAAVKAPKEDVGALHATIESLKAANATLEKEKASYYQEILKFREQVAGGKGSTEASKL